MKSVHTQQRLLILVSVFDVGEFYNVSYRCMMTTTPSSVSKTVRNRRYLYFQRHWKGGDECYSCVRCCNDVLYRREDAMRNRNPLLWEELIGQ